MSGIGVTSSGDIPEPDWFWRTMDPDDSGDSVDAAMDCTAFFKVDEIASSYVGPTRFYFKSPTLDPTNDDEEVLGFDTREEAENALSDRVTAVKAAGKWDGDDD